MGYPFNIRTNSLINHNIVKSTAIAIINEAQVALAIQEYRTRLNLSIRALAKKYSLSRATLTRRINDGESSAIAYYSRLLLSLEQEKILVQ